MKKRNLAYAALLMFGITMTGCNSSGEKPSQGTPELTKMKSEFVPDGEDAVIYGKNLKDAEVLFPGTETPAVVKSSNDSVLIVTVPKGATSGQLTVKNSAKKEVKSSFIFRDDRNFIINFDDYLATWGGYNPLDASGQKIAEIQGNPLPAVLPNPCSGKYGFLFGDYNTPWTMKEAMFLQYVANLDEGGRGALSVAGQFESLPLDSLVLKFEVNIPKEVSYKGVRTEIFFGPYNSPDKHGRDVSAICFWEPFKKSENGFYTDGWETVTIPLTDFTHGITSDEEVKKLIDLKSATNFSFVQFGAPQDVPVIFMSLDNFRIVPISK